jgi:hypothetical protein
MFVLVHLMPDTLRRLVVNQYEAATICVLCVRGRVRPCTEPARSSSTRS